VWETSAAEAMFETSPAVEPKVIRLAEPPLTRVGRRVGILVRGAGLHQWNLDDRDPPVYRDPTQLAHRGQIIGHVLKYV
jgi:hypothetical protein